MTTQSILNRIPENTSYLQTTKYTLSFPNMPFLRYFCQTAIIPGVQTSAVAIPTPFATTFRHGDTLAYSELTVSAIIDEDLRVWEETYDWLKALTKPTQFLEYVRFHNKDGKPYQDAILTVLNNANLPNIRIKYADCHPTNLGGIDFDVKKSANDALVADIVFKYDYFEIERL